MGDVLNNSYNVTVKCDPIRGTQSVTVSIFGSPDTGEHLATALTNTVSAAVAGALDGAVIANRAAESRSESSAVKPQGRAWSKASEHPEPDLHCEESSPDTALVGVSV